jgi:hypothetical protein
VYLDDILIVSATREDHEKYMRSVLGKLRENNFITKRKNCEFFRKVIQVLWHVISEDGTEVYPTKSEVTESWLKPETYKQALSSL